MGKIKPMIPGERHNRLTFVEESDIGYGIFKCDCGKMVRLCKSRVRCGNTKSCGCAQIDAVRKTGMANKKTNEYDLVSYDYAVGYTKKGEPFIFDIEDYDIISKYHWHIGSHGYVCAKSLIDEGIKAGESKVIKIQSVIKSIYWPSENKKDVDHINGDKTDNRKTNLRIATRSQNMFNTKRRKDNISGVKGVYYNNRVKKWIAALYENKRSHVTYHNAFEDAVKSRKEMEEKYHGDYVRK